MAAPFQADHVVGAAVAHLRACATGIETMLHVGVGCLIVVMHNAPFAVIHEVKRIVQRRKRQTTKPSALESVQQEIVRNLWTYSHEEQACARKLSWKKTSCLFSTL